MDIQADVKAHALGKTAQRLAYLRDRWQDEREYEDFADYVAEARKCFPAENPFSFEGMTRAFKVKLTHKPSATRLEMTVGARAITVKTFA
jgi:hypothetical protein